MLLVSSNSALLLGALKHNVIGDGLWLACKFVRRIEPCGQNVENVMKITACSKMACLRLVNISMHETLIVTLIVSFQMLFCQPHKEQSFQVRAVQRAATRYSSPDHTEHRALLQALAEVAQERANAPALARPLTLMLMQGLIECSAQLSNKLDG